MLNVNGGIGDLQFHLLADLTGFLFFQHLHIPDTQRWKENMELPG